MKKLVFIIVSVVLIATFSSCTKTSYNCCLGGQCTTVDQSSFSSKAQFDNYIKTIRAGGYTCK